MTRFSLLIALFVLFNLFASIAQAQTGAEDTTASATEVVSPSTDTQPGFDANDIRLRFDIGLAFTNLSGSADGVDFDSDLNIYIGLVGFYPFRNFERLGVLSGIHYVGRGASVESTTLSLYENVSFNLRYIEIPLMISYHLLDRLQLSAGPTLDFLVSSEVNVSALSGFAQSTNDLDNIRFFDAGFAIDLTYLVPRAREQWALNLRWGRGLIDITTDDDISVRNQYFQVGGSFIPNF